MTEQCGEIMWIWYNDDSVKYKYTLCKTCNIWYRVECEHICENAKREIKRTAFISESEMEI